MSEFTFCKIANEHFNEWVEIKDEEMQNRINEEVRLKLEEEEMDLISEYKYNRNLNIVSTLLQGVFGFAAVGLMWILLVVFALVVQEVLCNERY